MKRPQWRTVGSEPDYRFTLANERTFLAWIRTALALLAGGILLDQFSTRLEPRSAVVLLALALCSMAAVVSALAYLRWRSNEMAMRHLAPLPHSHAILILALCSLASAAIIVFLFMVPGN